MTQPEKRNSIKDLMDFFSTADRPVTPKEFRDFWNSIDEAGKEYYKSAAI